MTNQLNMKVKKLSAAEYGEFLSRGKMPAGEEAARRYLGKKYAQKMARIDLFFVGVWIGVVFAAIVAPFVLILGA